MTVRLNVKSVAEQLGIINANQLAALAGIGLTSAYKLWSGDVDMVSLDTLNRLCKSLGTHPASLFEYEPDKNEAGGKSLVERIAEVQQAKRGRPSKVQAEKTKPKRTEGKK